MNEYPRLGYALEKYEDAVYILATNPYDVTRRLRVVANRVMLVGSADVPDTQNVREDIRWIRNELMKYRKRWKNDSEVSASQARIRLKTGERIAERIYSVYSKLVAYHQDSRSNH